MAKIFLCGFMGAGKTYTAEELSRKYNYNFIDLDEYIIKKEKRNIFEIFENEGEEYFRVLEKNYLKEIVDKDNVIISLGGATVLDKDNVKLIKDNNGIIVFLDTDIDTIIKRIYGDDKRPLIKSKSPYEISELYTTRLDIYKDVADITITYNTKEKIDKYIKGES